MWTRVQIKCAYRKTRARAKHFKAKAKHFDKLWTHMCTNRYFVNMCVGVYVRFVCVCVLVFQCNFTSHWDNHHRYNKANTHTWALVVVFTFKWWEDSVSCVHVSLNYVHTHSHTQYTLRWRWIRTAQSQVCVCVCVLCACFRTGKELPSLNNANVSSAQHTCCF